MEMNLWVAGQFCILVPESWEQVPLWMLVPTHLQAFPGTGKI